MTKKIRTKKNYTRKTACLSAIVAVLALILIGTVVFDPERTALRNAAFAWIEPRLLDLADRIEISGSQGSTVLSRKNNVWVISNGGTDYPVKQARVEDFLKVLSGQELYQVRSNSASAHERLGVVEGRASRIVIRGGAGLPLLDLLIGFAGAAGREVYLRKAGQNEVRSGEDRFTVYTESPGSSWYDLRLFPDLETDMIQRVRVAPFRQDEAPYALSRNGRSWSFSDAQEPPEASKVESWLRSLADAEAEDFSTSIPQSGAVLSAGSIFLELGNGDTVTLRLGQDDGGNRRDASVSVSPFVYSLSEWTVNRLFREASYFMQEE
ncbi:MAG: DUF4340 domain-containing protein [Treponema sp.]|jgi:hypothetical protein|nr:DUF4340 domain-containing protein [Treponema sp.]